MRRIRLIKTILFGLLAVVITIPAVVHARAGKLDSPSIAMSTDTDGKPDRVSTGLLTALRESSDQFVEGAYINAATTMQFRGKWKHLGKMIKNLSEVDGAETSVTISRAKPFFVADAGGDPPPGNTIHWTVAHNGWGSPNHISITVNLPPVDDEDDVFTFPVIHGKAPKDKVE